MLEQSIQGQEVLRIPDRLQVVETTWQTWQTMYPATRLLSEDTGFSRDYDDYPYGSYRENNSLIFPANNSNDDRLHVDNLSPVKRRIVSDGSVRDTMRTVS